MPLLISNGFTPCSASSLVMNTWTQCSVFFLQHNPFSSIAMFACSEKLWQNLGDSTGVTLIVAKPFPGFWKMLESLRQQEAHSIREKAGHWSMLLLMGSYQISLLKILSRFFEKSDTWRGGLNICADRVLWGKIWAGSSVFPAFLKDEKKGKFWPRISNETIFLGLTRKLFLPRDCWRRRLRPWRWFHNIL